MPLHGAREHRSEMNRRLGYPAPHVYFARSSREGLVKIGMSAHPIRRMWSLRSTEKCAVQLITSVEVYEPGQFFERFAQALAADKHVRGEWFALSDAEITDIAQKVAQRAAKPMSKQERNRKAWPRTLWWKPRSRKTAYS